MSDVWFEPNLARAETPPSRWYFDPAQLEREQAAVFARTWQLVGRSSQIEIPGDFFTTTVAGEPLLIVRGLDGTVRALSNVCRHRAGPVANGSGHVRTFRCGYHGWTYGSDGRLLAAPEFDKVECFSREDVALPSFRIDSWLGLLFVNLLPGAPPLRDYLGDLPARVGDRGFEDFRLVMTKEWTIDCNWKVYVDNYLEGYHIPIVHPSLFQEIDYNNYTTETARHYSVQHSPIRRPERLKLVEGTSAEAQYFWLFPNLMINLYPDNFSTNLIVPLGPEKTLTLFEWFFKAPEDEEVLHRELARTVQFSDEIQIEDIAICEAVQRGLRSRTYDRGRYSVRRENGVHHFHGLLSDFLANGGSAAT